MILSPKRSTITLKHSTLMPVHTSLPVLRVVFLKRGIVVQDRSLIGQMAPNGLFEISGIDLVEMRKELFEGEISSFMTASGHVGNTARYCNRS